jgi:formate dehydrogenase subunit gamma
MFFHMSGRLVRTPSRRRKIVVARAPWNAEVAQQRIREVLHLDGPLLPILHALQDEFGYIDEAAEPLIATALNRSWA